MVRFIHSEAVMRLWLEGSGYSKCDHCAGTTGGTFQLRWKNRAWETEQTGVKFLKAGDRWNGKVTWDTRINTRQHLEGDRIGDGHVCSHSVNLHTGGKANRFCLGGKWMLEMFDQQ